VTIRLRLAALGAAEADAVLRAHGIADAGARRHISRWAGGLPLALTLAADGYANDPRRLDAVLADVSSDLTDRLTDGMLAQFDDELLTLVAIAGGVTPALLRAVLPGQDEAGLLARLAASSFVESHGGQVVLHPLLAEILIRHAKDSGQFDRLAMRVALAFVERAERGEPAMLERLSGLIRDPVIRAGLAPTSADFYGDVPRVEDRARLHRDIETSAPGAWKLLKPWLGEGGGAFVVRGATGACAGIGAALPLSIAEQLDPARRAIIEPVLAYAREQGLTGRAVVTAFQLTLLDDPDLAGSANAVGNAVAMRRCGVINGQMSAAIARNSSKYSSSSGKVPALGKVS
jgi:hypothetical protein